MVDKTLYGKYLAQTLADGSPYADPLYGAVKLLSLQVKRRRVDKISAANRLGSMEVREQPFKSSQYAGDPHIDDEERVEVVAEGKYSGITFVAPETMMVPDEGTNSVKPVLNVLKEEGISSTGPRNFDQKYGIKFFHGTDMRMSTITDGYYQYGVTLKIQDNTVGVLTNYLENLWTKNKDLEAYYKDATKKEKYNCKANKFTQTFKNKWSATTPTPSTVNAVIDTLQFFATNIDEDMDNLGTMLKKISGPHNGSPRGIMALQKLVLDLAAKIAKLAGTTLNKFDDNPHTNKKGTNTGTADKVDIQSTRIRERIIEVDYWFATSFDSDIPKTLGYDYLSPGGRVEAQEGNLGLYTLEGQIYENRLAQEMLKFYVSTTIDDFSIKAPDTGYNYTEEMIGRQQGFHI